MRALRVHAGLVLVAGAMLWPVTGRACDGAGAGEFLAAARAQQDAARAAYRLCRQRHPADWHRRCAAEHRADQRASRTLVAHLLRHARDDACASPGAAAAGGPSTRAPARP